MQVYLLQHGKKVHKKRTCTKKGERSPIFNEAMIFSVPAHTLQVGSRTQLACLLSGLGNPDVSVSTVTD
jgi:hypothetical protein